MFGPDTGEPPPETPPLVEIAVSEATAAAIGVGVGGELVGSVDPTDPLVPGTPDQPLRARFEVTGIFAIDDPRAEIWYADNRLNEITCGGPSISHSHSPLH